MTEMEIKTRIAGIEAYDYGQSTAPFFRLDEIVNSTHADARARRAVERVLAAVLESEAPLAAKQEVCRRLWRIGTDMSLDALAKMLGSGDLHLVEAACYAIGVRPSAKADAALRAALGGQNGKGRAAIENLLRARGA